MKYAHRNYYLMLSMYLVSQAYNIILKSKSAFEGDSNFVAPSFRNSGLSCEIHLGTKLIISVLV